MDTSRKREQYPFHDFSRLPLTSGRNQTITEVIQMNRLRDIRTRRVMAFMAMLFGAMVTTMVLPAHAQQDVDPTWYDPYAVHTAPIAAPQTVAAHSYQPPVAIRGHQPALTSVSLVQ